jgi:hypothetical protein
LTKGLETFANVPFLEEALKEKGLLPEEHRPQDGIEEPEKIKTIEEEFDDDLNDTSLSDMLQESDSSINEILKNSARAEQTLAMIEGIDHSEAMDRVYKETLKLAQDLADLAYNMPENRMRGIFEQAGNFYGKAIEAKNSKRDSQLKAMKLALEKRRLDLDEMRIKGQTTITDGNAVVEDRNALIRMRIEEMKKGPKPL